MHVRFKGTSIDLEIDGTSMEREDILRKVAQHFDVGMGEVTDLVIDRPVNGNVVVRPEAVYG